MVTFTEVLQARKNIRGCVEKTPLEHSRRLSRMFGADIYLKLENFRELRSFKVRGTTNFIASNREKCRENGVVAASGGSHALGVAWAAAMNNIQATIVMTERAPRNLVRIVESFGAGVEVKGQVYDDACRRAGEIAAGTGALYIDSFNDPYIIAGQGTIALEMLEEVPDLDTIICPVGGGGLLAGAALAAKTMRPECRVLGVEPENACAMYRSLAADRLVVLDNPRSIADKLVTRQTGELNFRMAKRYADAVYCVSEDQIRDAIWTFLNETSLLVEGAGAAPLALLQSGQLTAQSGKIGLVITGGNIDAKALAAIIARY